MYRLCKHFSFNKQTKRFSGNKPEMQWLVLAFMQPRIDYCNVVLVETLIVITSPLQPDMNVAAHVVAVLGPPYHATQTLCELHWLPVV